MRVSTTEILNDKVEETPATSLEPPPSAIQTPHLAGAVTLLDSAAEAHMKQSCDGLQQVRPVNSSDPKFITADGGYMDVTHVGTAAFLPKEANQVFVAESLHANLLSQGQLENHGARREVDSADSSRHHWYCEKGKHMFTTVLDKKSNLYFVEFEKGHDVSEAWHELANEAGLLAAKTTKLWTSVEFPKIQQLVQLLHVVLGHAPVDRMIEVVEKQFFKNLPPELTVKAIRQYFPSACVNCLKGRAQKEAASAKPGRKRKRTKRTKKAEADSEDALPSEDHVACSDEGECAKHVSAVTRGSKAGADQGESPDPAKASAPMQGQAKQAK